MVNGLECCVLFLNVAALFLGSCQAKAVWPMRVIFEGSEAPGEELRAVDLGDCQYSLKTCFLENLTTSS